MPEAYIVDAVRTPGRARRGGRSAVDALRRPRAATCSRALMDRTGVDPGAVDDVIMGCCDTIGRQAGDVARTAWLVAGLPDHVPGVTIDRQCGSSQQAVHFAAQGVMSGTQDLVVAGGLQNMSAIPISSAMLVGQQYGFTTPFAESPGLAEAVRRPGGQPVPERRDDRREVGHQPRGHGGASPTSPTSGRSAAIDEGRFEREIAPVGEVDDRRGTASGHHPGEDGRAQAAGRRAAGSPRRSPRRSVTPPRAMLIASEQAVAGARADARAPASTTCRSAATTRSGCSPARSAPRSTRWSAAA